MLQLKICLNVGQSLIKRVMGVRPMCGRPELENLSKCRSKSNKKGHGGQTHVCGRELETGY